MKRNKTKAFTLAEVLITLIITGIVAAMTIPAILVRLQEDSFKSTFKREFSNFGQAYSKIIQANILPASSNTIFDELKKHYVYAKYCSASNTEGCWHTDNNWKDLDGTLQLTPATPGLILANGILMMLFSNTSSPDECKTYPASGTNICYGILIDVNGFKGPNVWGKDIFQIDISGKRASPGGTISTTQYCDRTQFMPWNGGGCAVKVIMNQDY